MEYICGKTEFQYHNSCVTLGKFDGLHRGHQLLFSYLHQYQQLAYNTVIFTFDYHPGNLFLAREMDLIYTEEEKRELLNEMGPDVLISYPFTKESASMEPEEFIAKILIQQLDAKLIVVGSDYRFGRGRRGDVAMLEAYAKVYGYQLIACDKLTLDGEVISSSRIRRELSLGHLEIVHKMLGRPYSITGTVVTGRQLGRTIGIPTVNILPHPHKLLPPYGVYASKIWVQGSLYYGVTSIGCKPTVEDSGQTSVETHIFDFNQTIYGQEIKVELYTYMRAEEKFSSIQELQENVKKDIEWAKNFFSVSPNKNYC